MPVHEEIRRNALVRIAEGRPIVEGVLGFEDTGPAPARERRSRRSRRDPARASGAKPRPGSSGPSSPCSTSGRPRWRLGDHGRPLPAGVAPRPGPRGRPKATHTPLTWVHRDRRFAEKLATPDTSIADLIGEVDPIKVAEGPLSLRRAHVALRPRAQGESRRLLHQRAPRPGRAHPGGLVERARGARRPDPGLHRAPAPGRRCWWRRPTPRTTPTEGGSSPR